jgi:hypothetical protein
MLVFQGEYDEQISEFKRSISNTVAFTLIGYDFGAADDCIPERKSQPCKL